MTNELLLKEEIKIESIIYEIRGRQVMLDSDLAKLYGCKNGTKSINLAVKRHINRFPERFMFQLTENEYFCLRFHFETANSNMTRNLPYVFTEEGVAMLSTVLKTSVAEEVSIRIMDAFVSMRKYLKNNNYDKRISNVETKIIDHDNKFDIIFDKLDSHINNYNLFFEGQIYDAYSLLIKILETSKKNIVIIDNYLDNKILDVIRKAKVDVTIITNKFFNIDLEKYNKQYHNLRIVLNNTFHDRFIIIDKKILYHSGASFKDLGKKCFSVTKIEDSEILKQLLNRINLLK